LKNLQSDIIGILDNNLELVVTYEYDEWGSSISITDANSKPITQENHIAHINPFRYRSYYYDQETRLYYLNSRYYNPEWKRFINADGIIGANKDHVGYNLYAYVSNNPIKFIDPTGTIILSFLYNYWNIDVKMSDIWNFDEKRNNKYGFISDSLNNFGYGLQNTGLTKAYYWEVTFSFSYKHKEEG